MRIKSEENSSLRPAKFSDIVHRYESPPTGSIDIDTFVRIARERLQLLTELETKGKNLNLSSFSVLKSEVEDKTSHYILKLANCNNEAKRRWFIQQETNLFVHRLAATNYTNDIEDDSVTVCTEDEISDIKEALITIEKIVNKEKPELTRFLMAKFEMVPTLVRRRGVFLRKGMAIFSFSQYKTILAKKFMDKLEADMIQMTSRYAEVQSTEANRLGIIIKQIEERSILESSSVEMIEGEVLPENIDALKKQSFPPCMRVLHNKLRKTHHLKHFGRMQYGLFLKDIGMSLQNALAFWSSEFTQIITQQKFDQQYAYNIRFNYGKEGKRANYSSFRCTKIINGTSEDCVCPFRHFPEDKLKQFLQSETQLPLADIEDMIPNIKRNGARDEHISCRTFFDKTHKIRKDKLPAHIYDELKTEKPFYKPTTFYMYSRKIYEAEEDKMDIS